MANTPAIVVAVDGSDASNAAVEWAANAAAKRGEPLHLVSAYTTPQFMYADGLVPPPELYEELQADANAKLAAATALVEAFATQAGVDIAVESSVHEASPIDLLLDLSETAVMIVMGSRGLGGLSGLVMGSVSAAVVSHAECPVVVVRKDNVPDAASKYGPVVVGVDGSEISRAAVALAFKEADARGAQLRAIHSWQESTLQTGYVGVVETQQQIDQIVAARREMLHQELQPFLEQYPNVDVVEIVERERPIQALKQAADDAQLLVLGSHGRGGFRGMLLGSTSRALLQYAPCPMMVVRRGQ